MTQRLRDESGEARPGGGVTRPPAAAKRPVTTTHFGIARTDDYGWLRADNWQQVMRDPAALAPDIRAYLDAENAYTDAATADVAGLKDALVAEMRARIKEDDSSVPSPDGPYAYGIRFAHGAEHPMLIRTDRDGGNETVLIDANAMADGKAYFHLGGSAHSPDHRLLAYAIDEMGSEYFEIRIRDLDTGADLPDRIVGTAGAPVWAADSGTILFVRLDDNHRPAKVLTSHHRHRCIRGRRRP